jgi:predicted PurR-regulated permease PerM
MTTANGFNLEKMFLHGLIAVAVLLFGLLVLPIMTSVLLGVVAATLMHPLHNLLIQKVKMHAGFAALITLAIFASVILAPLILIGVQVVQEGVIAYQYIDTESPAYQQAAVFLKQFASGDLFLSRIISLESVLQQASGFVTSSLSYLLSQVLSFSLGLLIFVFTFFYTLKDGIFLRTFLENSLPLPPAAMHKIFSKFYETVHGIFKGFFVVAAVQGILSALGFWIVGVPQPMLWGFVAACVALIPVFGTALITFPFMIFSFLFLGLWQGIFLMIWSGTAVGMADNVLRPFFTSRGAGLHPFFVFLSIIGGVELFGVAGFLIGPIIVAFLFVLLQIRKDVAS